MDNWFSDSAMAKLLQTLPELSPYILTFNDMSDQLQEGSDIKVGVFILQVGSRPYYIPVVAKGQAIFPIDSMFDSEVGQFLPISKKVLADIVNAGQIEIGNAARMPNTVSRNPSVQELVQPPKTGKVAYASSSRMMELMAAMPDHIKARVHAKITGSTELMQGLHAMFDLKDLLAALHVNKMYRAPSQRISVITEGTDLTPTELSQILTDGYAVRGENLTPTFAIQKQDYSASLREKMYNESAAYSATIFKTDGETIKVFVPAISPTGRHVLSSRGDIEPVAISTSGDLVVGTGIISGEKVYDDSAFKALTASCPALLPRDISSGMKFALLDQAGKLIGTFTAEEVTRTQYVDTIRVRSWGMYDSNINYLKSSRNVHAPLQCADDEVWIPSYSVVIPLNHIVRPEKCAVTAASRMSNQEAQLLEREVHLMFDGVEFAYNGKPVGGVPAMAETLIVHEGLAPDVANNLIKSAQEKKRISVMMSKRAFAEATQDENSNGAYVASPDFQNPNAPGSQIQSMDGLVPNVNAALQTNDSQAVEATLLAELLQAPDATEYIGEYLPDIEACMDKLGRILFLCRVHMGQLNEKISSDAIFSMVSNLRTVYRSLGDSYIRLKQLVAVGTDNDQIA